MRPKHRRAGSSPVSYTHLDVYKRQAEAFVPGAERQPLFMAHGVADPVVPYVIGERSVAVLRGLGFVPEWHPYPICLLYTSRCV